MCMKTQELFSCTEIMVTNLFLEALVEHLVSLVYDKHFECLCLQVPSSDHIKYAAWSARHNLNSIIQTTDVFPDAFATDASVALHAVGRDNVFYNYMELTIAIINN